MHKGRSGIRFDLVRMALVILLILPSVAYAAPEHDGAGTPLIQPGDEMPLLRVETADGKVRVEKVPRGTRAAAHARNVLRSSPAVVSATPVQVVSVDMPSDPDLHDAAAYTSGGVRYDYARSWWLRKMGAPEAWSYGNGSEKPLLGDAESFRVGVIDTGLYSNHPDIGDNVMPGYDLFESYTHSTGRWVTDADPTPPPMSAPGMTTSIAAHGTAVSATVAGAINDFGMVGIGYDVEVLNYKVLGIWTDGGSWGYTDGQAVILDYAVEQAMRRAVDDGCKVINLSLGGETKGAAYERGVKYARDRGVVVVASAGNDGSDSPRYPAAEPGVVAVSATGLNTSGNEVITGFSSYGDHVSLSAPGTMIWLPGHPTLSSSGGRTGYQWWSGTSFSAPAVAGSLAYLWRAAPHYSPDQLLDAAYSTALDLGAAGKDPLYGHGRMDIAAAYRKIVADNPTLGTVSGLSVPAVSPSSSVSSSWLPVQGADEYEVSAGGSTVLVKGTAAAIELPDGKHTVSVRALGPGWPGPAASTAVTVDTVAPTVTGLSVSGGVVRWTGDGTGTAATYEVSVDGSVLAAGIEREMYVPDILAGTYDFGVRATDEAGHRSGWVTGTFDYTQLLEASPVRVAGTNRYATAAEISRHAFPTGGVTDVVLTTGAAFPDALAAAPLAHALGAPLLLTPTASLHPDTRGEITRLGASSVTVVGGPASVSPAVADELESMGISVRRVHGQDRYETAAAVEAELRRVTGVTSEGVFVASGESYPDALAAAPMAASEGMPILLVRKASIPPATASVLASGRYSSATVVGGRTVISPRAFASLNNAVPASRLAGEDRFETAALVAATHLAGSGSGCRIGLANGSSFPDALAAGAALAARGNVLLLTRHGSIPAPAVPVLSSAAGTCSSVLGFGGTAVLCCAVIDEAAAIASIPR